MVDMMADDPKDDVEETPESQIPITLDEEVGDPSEYDDIEINIFNGEKDDSSITGFVNISSRSK